MCWAQTTISPGSVLCPRSKLTEVEQKSRFSEKRIAVGMYSRTSLSRMAKIQGICPGQRIIRDSGLGSGAKKFRIQGISSGTAGDPGE